MTSIDRLGGGDGPSEKAIIKALGRLCRNGVEIYWVRENAGVLFELRCVQECAARDFPDEEDALSKALIAILRERVEMIRHTQYGKILWIVLDLEEQYPEKTAKERRTIAGQVFRDGRRPVTHGTIRQHHEPKALEQLAELLLALEAQPQTA